MSLSLKSFVQNSKLLSSFLKPVSSAYANAAGYRKMGKEKENMKIDHLLLNFFVCISLQVLNTTI